MEQRDYLLEQHFAKPSVPAGINVLSILSFIGSGFQVIGAVLGYFIAPYNAKEALENNPAQYTREMKPLAGFLKWSNEMSLRQLEYRVPILIVTLLTAVLCIYGVLEMRKLKKSGFTIYCIGELGLPLFTAIVIGFWAASFGFVIAILFIILFAVRRKYLIN
ncbi:MAG: hypothetical protein GXC73_05875 [Chitinophagaceae bacterium]|nr:hypothetical protein [Chitinophagaceae bacterium]